MTFETETLTGAPTVIASEDLLLLVGALVHLIETMNDGVMIIVAPLLVSFVRCHVTHCLCTDSYARDGMSHE